MLTISMDVTLSGLGTATVSEESRLVERLCAGDVSAVGEAYDTHHESVRTFALRLTGDPAAAEDLVHEVFVTLPKAVRRFRCESSLRTFLVSIAINHSRHYVRAAARRRRALDRFAEEPPSVGDTPEQAFSRRQLGEILSRALDTLPLDQRVAFELCEVEERTSREASELVGVPEGTIRTRLHHAKRKLRDLLAQQGVGR
jgi:RNA polymerase sigma-70 factor (ECF subfamily)